MRHFERGGYVFDVLDSGPADGPLVVLLHGFPQDAGAWSNVVPALNEAGFRTLSMNMRGVSQQASPTEVNQYRTIESVNDVVALLDSVATERAHIVGHDFGGLVAWGIACEYPDRVITLTVVSTPHPAAMQRAMLRSTQALQSWYMGVFQIPVVAEELLAPRRALWRAMVRGMPASHSQRYAQRLGDKRARSNSLAWYRVLPREIARPSVSWSKVSLPTLYVWGEKDPALSRAAAEGTADFLTGTFRLEEIRAGHWIPETRPVLLAALLLEHLQQNA